MLRSRKARRLHDGKRPVVRGASPGRIRTALSRTILVTLLALAGACKNEQAPQEPSQGPQALQPPPVTTAPPPERRLVELQIQIEKTKAKARWQAESLGMGVALLERGLTDLRGLVPRVEQSAPSPGLSERLGLGFEAWTARFKLVPGRAELLSYELQLCDPQERCTDHQAVSDRVNPERAVSKLLTSVTSTLNLEPLPGAVESWSLPVSKDPYAVLLCGRSAAIWYGILPPPPPSNLEDKRYDAVTRAVFLDPRMPPALWIEGRRRAGAGEHRRALVSFTRASLERPSSVIFLADQAASLSALGQAEAALTIWREIDDLSPWDPRFILARAKAAIQGNRPEEARHLLNGLPERFQEDPQLAALRVSIADAQGAHQDLAGLLQRWQDLSPTDPEPVRRRIGLLVEEKRLAEALVLTEDLAGRGAEQEASRMALSLATGLQDWDRAIAEAQSLGLADVALKLRARRALASDPLIVPEPLIGLQDVSSKLARGEVMLQKGEGEKALGEADSVLSSREWDPGALSLRTRALSALGRDVAARETLEKLRAVDPRRAVGGKRPGS